MEKDFERRLSHSSARVIFSTGGQTGLSGAKMQKPQKCKMSTHEKISAQENGRKISRKITANQKKMHSQGKFWVWLPLKFGLNA